MMRKKSSILFISISIFMFAVQTTRAQHMRHQESMKHSDTTKTDAHHMMMASDTMRHAGMKDMMSHMQKMMDRNRERLNEFGPGHTEMHHMFENMHDMMKDMDRQLEYMEELGKNEQYKMNDAFQSGMNALHSDMRQMMELMDRMMDHMGNMHSAVSKDN